MIIIEVIIKSCAIDSLAQFMTVKFQLLIRISINAKAVELLRWWSIPLEEFYLSLSTNVRNDPLI